MLYCVIVSTLVVRRYIEIDAQHRLEEPMMTPSGVVGLWDWEAHRWM